MRAFHLAALLPAFLAVEASVLEAPIPGYEVYVPEWEVQATPGGPTIVLNGTVEEVVDKLHEINPDSTTRNSSTRPLSSPQLCKSEPTFQALKCSAATLAPLNVTDSSPELAISGASEDGPLMALVPETAAVSVAPGELQSGGAMT
ncbi:hypothetical protein COL922a_013639 [Colletotrichum nupharicola]|nr:hypothetical protein COL922a_013639 [Colletotrichum nupharicola]